MSRNSRVTITGDNFVHGYQIFPWLGKGKRKEAGRGCDRNMMEKPEAARRSGENDANTKIPFVPFRSRNHRDRSRGALSNIDFDFVDDNEASFPINATGIITPRV